MENNNNNTNIEQFSAELTEKEKKALKQKEELEQTKINLIREIMEKIKNELYDIIEYENEKYDKYIVRILDRVFGGPLDGIYIYLINPNELNEENRERLYFISKTDIMYGNVENRIKEIQFAADSYNFKFEILVNTGILNFKNNVNVLALMINMINPVHAGALILPLQRIVHPSEGEQFAITDYSLMNMFVIKGKNQNFNIGPFNFIKPKIILYS